MSKELTKDQLLTTNMTANTKLAKGWLAIGVFFGRVSAGCMTFLGGCAEHVGA